jgi:hypothetical protein
VLADGEERDRAEPIGVLQQLGGPGGDGAGVARCPLDRGPAVQEGACLPEQGGDIDEHVFDHTSEAGSDAMAMVCFLVSLSARPVAGILSR